MNHQYANIIKIRCNPYKKQISYYFYNEESELFEDLKETDEILALPKYQNNTLQNVLYDIIELLNNRYNVGNVGLYIAFEGTQEDSNDFKQVLSDHFSEYDIKFQFNGAVYLSATEVKKRIEGIYKSCKRLFEQYKTPEIENLLEKYTQTVKPTIPICIMGLYSAGKSAFINSLLGLEILPSKDDVTTAKIYKISNSKSYMIKCVCYSVYGEKQDIVLKFFDDTYKPNVSKKNPLVSALQVLSDSSLDTPEKKMRKAIEIINDSDTSELFSVGDLIEISLPIKNDSLDFEEFDYVIYDTPGSNPASFEKHIGILKDAMDSQTNGLPIFVTYPKAKDAKDNEQIIDRIAKMEGRLDRTNLMILINQADEGIVDQGTAKGGVIQNLQPAGVFLLSSIIGLGYKKSCRDEELIDSGYYDVYDDRIKKFSDPDKRNYTELYRFNVLPILFHDDYQKQSQNAPLVYRNSGLHCVELYIHQFAQKYALYNKCSQACLFLSKAICILSKLIDQEAKKKEGLIESFNQNLENEKKKLLADIKKAIEELLGLQIDNPQKKIQCDQSETFEFQFSTMANGFRINEDELREFIGSTWKLAYKNAGTRKKESLKKARGLEWVKTLFSYKSCDAVIEAKPIIMKYALSKVKTLQTNLNQETITTCNNWEKKLKERCLRIIFDCDCLNEEQKQSIKLKMQSVGLIKPEKIEISLDSNELFESFMGFRYLSKKASDHCSDAIMKVIRKSRSDYIKDATKKYCTFSEDLFSEIRNGIAGMNPTLISIQAEISLCQKAILKFEKEKDQLEKWLDIIQSKLMGGDVYEGD